MTLVGRKIARERKIDIIHAHDTNVGGLSAVFIKAFSNRKLIVKYAGDLVVEYESFTAKNPEKPEEILKKKTFRARMLLRLQRYIFGKADLIQVQNRYQRDILRKYYGVGKNKIVILPNHVDKIFKPKKEVEVEAKGVKLIVSFNDLDILDHAEVKSDAISNSYVESMHVSNEIDLRGKLADDAIIEMQKYLDQAVYSNWNEVRIIHGKGTGALRKKIHEYLRKKRIVKSFRLGKVGEGDTGVTVIEI